MLHPLVVLLLLETPQLRWSTIAVVTGHATVEVLFVVQFCGGSEKFDARKMVLDSMTIYIF